MTVDTEATTVRAAAPTERPSPPGPSALRRLAGALPGGRWWRLLWLAGGLLLAAQLLGSSALRSDIATPERIAAYERRGYDVSAGDTLTVSRELRSGKRAKRDLGAHLQPQTAAALVAIPVGAALLVFVLLQLGAWIDARRPANRALVRWDEALPVLWLLPVGLSVILLSRLAVDVPAASPARFPEALAWPGRQARAAAFAALAIPLSALLCGIAERFDWGQRFLHRSLLPQLQSLLPEVEARLPLRLHDGLLFAACGLFAVTGLLGSASFGATLSVSVGGAAVQVIEVAKLLLVLHAAYVLADHERRAGPGERALRLGLRDPRTAKMAISAVLAGGTAVVATGDIGTAVLAAAIPLLAGIAATGSMALLGGATATGLLGLGAVLLLHRPAYVYRRVAGLLAPFERSETLTGVRWALAEGGLLGTGLGSGHPQAIPNVASDFVLAAVGEELGLAGLTLVLLATAALVHRGLLIAAREEEPLRKHLAAAASLAIFAQAAVITAGTLGLLPATGVPYPLVSRGGASLVVHSALIGVLAQVSAHRPAPVDQPLVPYPGWRIVLLRLRAIGMLALGSLTACWAFAAWLMVARADDDRDRAYVDVDKVRLVHALAEGGALVPDESRVVPRPGALEAAAATLEPELRRRVSVSRKRVDGRSLTSLASVLDVRDGRVHAQESRFSIRNPRRRVVRPFRLVDRVGRVLAHDKKGRRHHPYAEATFPVVGHRGAGSSSFLENDADAALDKLLRRDAALHPDRLRARLLTLLSGKLAADRPRGPWTVRSTLDRLVQRNAMAAMAGKQGAAVAIDLQTGGVLALATQPTIDPDAALAAGTLDDAFRDPALRLRAQRALKELYPPGSTMKLVTAAALAEQGIDLDALEATCKGTDADLRVGDAGSRRKRGHGRIELPDAIGRSCNVYFARAGVKLGPKLQDMAARLGFGRSHSLVPWLDDAELASVPSHILTCRSVAGSGPLPKGCAGTEGAAGAEFVAESWVRANDQLVARAAFGQTVVEATPLQMAQVASTIALRGLSPQLRLLDAIDGRCDDEDCPLATASPDFDRVLSPAAALIVHEGMKRAYESGTARAANLSLRLGRRKGRYTLERKPGQPVAVAAKTGTAEVQDAQDHAWFLAYAPADAPRVAVAVIVEHGGSGATGAGPAAMMILRDALNALP